MARRILKLCTISVCHFLVEFWPFFLETEDEDFGGPARWPATFDDGHEHDLKHAGSNEGASMGWTGSTALFSYEGGGQLSLILLSFILLCFLVLFVLLLLLCYLLLLSLRLVRLLLFDQFLLCLSLCLSSASFFDWSP